MILGTSRAVRVFAYPEPVDRRKGYDGLYGLVKQGLKRDPMSGELFLFSNRRRRGCKVLVWDGTGLCIFQKRLEREKVFELDEPDRTCPACGERLDAMPGQFESSEMIDFVEISYRLVKVKQQKYVCRCGGCVETAPGPERAVKGGRYSLAFAIKVALDKYLDHIPLARQQRILARHGVVVAAQTLWDQVFALGNRLSATADALFRHALAQPVIGLDQTSWPKLDGQGDKPWQMWCITAPGIVCHKIRDDKGKDTFQALVGSYAGVIVCDALKTHEAGARGNSRIQLAGCWAHVFRKFEEALPNHPEAQLALDWIGQLYAIDERAGPDLEARAALRSSESTNVLTELKTWLWSQAVLKTLSIGKAAAYTIANWERLVLFSGNPLISLDNNGTERGIRGPVVGCKNHYDSRSRFRYRRRRDAVHARRDREAASCVPDAVLARSRARRRPRRGADALAAPDGRIETRARAVLRVNRGVRTGRGRTIRRKPIQMRATDRGEDRLRTPARDLREVVPVQHRPHFVQLVRVHDTPMDLAPPLRPASRRRPSSLHELGALRAAQALIEGVKRQCATPTGGLQDEEVREVSESTVVGGER